MYSNDKINTGIGRYKILKKILILPLAVIIVIFMAINCAAAEYTFNYSNGDQAADQEIDDFLSSLPDDVRNKISDISTDNAGEAVSNYDINFFTKEFVGVLNDYIPTSFTLFSVISSIIILTSVVGKLTDLANNTECKKAYDFCSAMCIVLAIFTLRNGSYELAENMLKTMSSAMSLMVPVMEAIYISAGNAGLAAVTGTGMNIMLTAAEALYSKILAPAVTISFTIACISSVTKNKGLLFLSKTIRTAITTAIVFIMSMTSIILSMQTSLSASADKFSARAVRFALGSYVPIVGGAVSESLSAFTSSISLLKQLAGTTGIVVIFLIILPPTVSLIMTKLSIFCSSTVAGMLGCEDVKSLLDEIGGTYTMMIAISLCASISFIYALSLFSKAALALS